MRLDNKVALISGAAAALPGELTGFGGAAAQLFLREGAKVVITDLQDELGERSAAALREEGGDVQYLHLDVTSASQWTDAIEETVSAYGKLDILVNNAGISVAARVEDLSEAEWDAELSVHAKGVFLGTRAAIPAMRVGGGGSIINISSIMGIVGSPTSPAYSAAKGAIRIFTKSTALQYARENIRVNSVHPGYADTPLKPRGVRSARGARGVAAPDPDAPARHRRRDRLGHRLPRERRVGLRHRFRTGDRRRNDRTVVDSRST